MTGNIESFLEYLSSFTRIDFKGKERELGSLAQKYDKDKNSIFDQDELFAMQDDISIFVQTAQNDDIETNQINTFLSNLIEIGKQNIENLKKKYLDKYSDKREFTEEDISFLAELTDKELKRAKQLFYVKGRKVQFDGCGIRDIVMGLNDKEFKRVKAILNAENNREPLFNPFDIQQLTKLNDEEFKKTKVLFNVEKREHQFEGAEIAQFAKLNEEEFERAKQLFNVENRKEQFDGYGITKLAKLNDEEFERAKQLFNVENREQQFDGYDIAELAKLNNEEFERAKQLFNLKTKDVDIKRGTEIERELKAGEIIEISKLSIEQYEQFKQLQTVKPVRTLYFEGLIYLSKLNADDFQWLTKYLSKADFDIGTIISLVNNHCKELEEEIDSQFLKSENNSYYYSPAQYRTGYGIKLRVHSEDNIKRFNVYDKTGIIETTEYEKIPDSESIVNGKKITCYNKNLKVKQETIIGDIPNTDDKNIVFSEVLTYFDDDGNVIRIVTTKRNPENGTLNVSETDKNGKQTPIQWESIDPNTGANITERHLTSPEPDCTKTDCYFEENDNLKISDYKVTDKDGSVLINVHQTFEQVSENKFISSILATDDPNDTQIYEMEYSDDRVVKIFDKKNNKTTELDLNKYADSKETLAKLMPSIKRLPGQILLKIADKPFKIRYDKHTKTNGQWNLFDKELMIGNYDNTVGKNENIYGTLLHELGHYLDFYGNLERKFSDNADIETIYEKGKNNIISHMTTEQQNHIENFIGEHGEINGKNITIREPVAEAHRVLYSKEKPFFNMRSFYLTQNMPELMARTMKLMLEEEGIKVL